VSSTASLTSSNLPVGTDTVIVNYNGTQNFAPATSTINEVILPLAVSTMTLTSSVNPSVVGQSVTFTATLALPGVGPAPTGTITFLDGTSVLGTAALSAVGVATLTTSALALGSHTITANYPGDLNNSPTSASLIQVVNAAIPSGFTLTVTPTPISVGVGLSGSLIVTITPTGGFNQPITLSCANLPNEAACTFGESTIPAGSGSTTLLIATTSPHTCGSNEPYFVGRANPSAAPFTLPMLAGLIALFLPGRKRWLKSILAALAVATLFHTTACGTCTDLATLPGTYTVTVTGTPTTAQSVSQLITLNVTI
jgi:hypothetical protein